ncbi:MAG TPA: hypothetical protein DCM54_13660 [Gammaproteobacteria bacterium]|nr:hypothetical protein [Gammaproteobacteria bacterium]|tara:strand:- start:1412 stop:1738 length:327 start_codon:yes stop_codon:yes gene_type:complete
MTDQLTEKAKALLDESAEHMDAETLAKLHQARSRALESDSTPVPWYGWTSGGLVTAGVLLGLFIYQSPSQPPVYADPVEQEIVENMELLDDLEFMAWMILQEETDASS